jgi:23S rRNA (adenine2503-C2)-methyltransferase
MSPVCKPARSARAFPLAALLEECRTYFKITGRRVTFEYTLMSGVNDSPENVRAPCP